MSRPITSSPERESVPIARTIPSTPSTRTAAPSSWGSGARSRKALRCSPPDLVGLRHGRRELRGHDPEEGRERRARPLGRERPGRAARVRGRCRAGNPRARRKAGHGCRALRERGRSHVARARLGGDRARGPRGCSREGGVYVGVSPARAASPLVGPRHVALRAPHGRRAALLARGSRGLPRRAPCRRARAPHPMTLTRSEAARKALHIGMALFALMLPSLTWIQAALAAGIACLFNVLVLPRVAPYFLRRDEGERGFSVGITLYLSLIHISEP